MISLASFVPLALVLSSVVLAFPPYGSLSALSKREMDEIVLTLPFHPPPPPPGPPKFTGAKLVNDKDHPWMPTKPGDLRGPCPGMNTLASHGYLPRSGIVTPVQIINAVQEGFNMANDIATFVAYVALIVDGNVITGQLSIGGKTSKTGPDPQPPATAAGLSTHVNLEGDARDALFGDNHSFNETLFQQFVDYSNRFGNGKYNLTVAGEYKWKRIQDSIATNPAFSFGFPRYFTAYAESVFPINFFIDGRKEDGQLDLDVALGFFRDMRMPPGFFRPSKPHSIETMHDSAAAHPIQPGGNVGGVNNYVPSGVPGDLASLCPMYEAFMNVVQGLYPNPTGILRKALDINLGYMYTPIKGQCTQIFPWGK